QPLRRLEVHGFDLDEREVPLAVFRRPDLPRHGVAGVQVELPDLGGGDVDVVGPRQVVVVGRAQEPEAVGQHLEHALGEDQAALLGARLENLEDQLLLAQAADAGHVQLLGDLRELADAQVLERREIYAFGFVRRGRGFDRLAINFHRSSIPSPVAADTGTTGASYTD